MQVFNLCDKQEHINEVMELEHNEWGMNPEFERQKRINNKVTKYLSNIGKNDFCKLVLIDDEKLVGFISIFPHDCEEEVNLTPWYATMYVKKEYRGKGYSKILNGAILYEAKKRGIKTLYIKTKLNNYYEKFGAVFVKEITNGERILKIEITSNN